MSRDIFCGRNGGLYMEITDYLYTCNKCHAKKVPMLTLHAMNQAWDLAFCKKCLWNLFTAFEIQTPSYKMLQLLLCIES